MAAAGPLSTDEYETAEILWLREMQQAVVESPRFESLKKQLGLCVDDNGLLRCKGRLQNATIPFNAKYPILLPADHCLTARIIHDCHKRVLHNETEVPFLDCKRETSCSEGAFKMRDLQEDRRETLRHPTNCAITSIPCRRESCFY